MNAKSLQLLSAPIIEAAIDIDCDMPPAMDLAALESSRDPGVQHSVPKAANSIDAGSPIRN